MHPIALTSGNSRRLTAGILLLATGLFIVHLGDRSLTSEEVRWGQIAREMRQTGQWFHPTINGQLYYDKPLASYWLIVAASHLSGESDEFAARLPSALAGILSVLLTIHLGQHCYDRRHGLLAGLLLTTMFGFTIYARRASADMENLAGILAAVTLFAQMQAATRCRWVIALWLIMGVTSSMKGLLGFALPILIISVFCLANTLAGRTRTEPLWKTGIRANRWFFNPWSLLAVPLGIGCFLAPYMISSMNSGSGEGLAMVVRENLQRFVAPHNHTGPVTLYLGAILLLAVPWSLFLPAALIPQAKRDDSDGHRFIATVFWVTFLFFTASASRRSYYLLPILPATCLLIARLLLAQVDDLRPLARRLRNAGGLLFVIGFALGVAGLAVPVSWRPAPYNTLPAIPGSAVAVFLGTIATLAMLRQLWMPSIPLLTTVVYATFVFVMLVLMPATEQFRTRRSFAIAVREQTQQDWFRLALFHARDIVFELDPPQSLRDFSASEPLSAAFQDGTVHWTIIRRRYLSWITFDYTIVCEEAVQPWEGSDQIGDKMVLIRAAGLWGDRNNALPR